MWQISTYTTIECNYKRVQKFTIENVDMKSGSNLTCTQLTV